MHPKKLQLDVRCISEGLGFGAGTITGQPAGVAPEILALVDHTIEFSPDILVLVDRDKDGNMLDDDGCGDGRSVDMVFKGRKILKRSLHRAKVFGGALVMDMAIRIGLGKTENKLLNSLYASAMSDLAEARIEYGAHTDDHDHSHDENCGCGAIDKTPQSVANIIRFRDRIATVITELDIDSKSIETIFDNFAAYNEIITGKAFSGRQVSEDIISNDKVVKRLKGPHLEARIILNMVAGYTANQELIRQISDGKVQVFAVDVWRMSAIARRRYPDNADLQHKAFLSELVYTCGVAATLTDGTLPVYTISSVPAVEGAQAA